MSITRETRRQVRALCSELVRISFRDQRGRCVQEAAVLEDLAEKGVRISLSLPLTPGAQVGLQAAAFEVKAYVRYCELADTGFAVGLEFSDDFRWDEKEWAPEHLLHLPGSGLSEP